MSRTVSYGFICRDCLARGHYGINAGVASAASHSCPACGSTRVVLHDELFALTIAHVDCDAFYCSVEKRDNPELRDLPVIVGGVERGVVAAACYVARRYGIRSAMPAWQARKACPDLVVIKPRIDHYQAVGAQIKQMMLALTPLVQPLSIDEAFLDLSGTQKLHKTHPAVVLAEFQKRVREEVGVSVSVGLAQNKSMAKIASDQDKPDGFYVIGVAEAQDWLRPRPVDILYGLGKVTTRRLNAAGLQSCGDIVVCPTAKLRTMLGRDAERIKQLAGGVDPRSVEVSREVKSVSSEITFAQDICELSELLSVAETQTQTVSRRLKEKQMQAVQVTIKLKRPNHRTLTRAVRLAQPTQMAHRLFDAASGLIEKQVGPDKFWRLLGVGVSVREGTNETTDESEKELELFGGDAGGAVNTERQDKLERAIDDVHAKLGAELIKTGRRFSHETEKKGKTTPARQSRKPNSQTKDRGGGQ